MPGRGVLSVAARDERQQPVDPGRVEPAEQLGDLAADPGEVLDEPLQILDQPVLVGAERVGVELVQVDRPLQRSHERLRVLGEIGAAAHEVAQQQPGPRDVRLGLARELAQGAQTGGDVLQRDRLQRSAPAELLVEHRERPLRRLAGVGELVQEPRAVEVLDARHPARVRIGPQVAPLHELGERVGDRLRVHGDGAVGAAPPAHPRCAGARRTDAWRPRTSSITRRYSPAFCAARYANGLNRCGIGMLLVGCHRLAHGGTSGRTECRRSVDDLGACPSTAASIFVVYVAPGSALHPDPHRRAPHGSRGDARLGSLLTELEEGEVEKLVLTQRNRMRAVVVSVERWSQLEQALAVGDDASTKGLAPESGSSAV